MSDAMKAKDVLNAYLALVGKARKILELRGPCPWRNELDLSLRQDGTAVLKEYNCTISYGDAEIYTDEYCFPAHLLDAPMSAAEQWAESEKASEQAEWAAAQEKRQQDAAAQERALYQALRAKYGAE